jgi:hypothetical protein
MDDIIIIGHRYIQHNDQKSQKIHDPAQQFPRRTPLGLRPCPERLNV